MKSPKWEGAKMCADCGMILSMGTSSCMYCGCTYHAIVSIKTVDTSVWWKPWTWGTTKTVSVREWA